MIKLNKMLLALLLLAPPIQINAGKGSGPISAGIAYWTTKTIAYGTMVAAAAGLIATGTGIAPAIGGGIVTAATGAAPASVGVVAGMISAGGGTAVASETAVVIISESVAGASVAATIEGAAAAVGAFFMMLPLP